MKEIESGTSPLSIKQAEVLRDEHGRIIWKLPGNTPDQNLQLGIRNVQGLFLLKFPQFGDFFVLNPEGNVEVAQEKKEDSVNFVLDNLPDQKAFHRIIGGSATNKRVAPYFGGSFQQALTISFASLGVSLDFKRRGKGFWEEKRIKAEAIKYYDEHSDISRRGLIANNKSSLANAIARKYPGGFYQLRVDLKIESKKKPGGFWTEDRIREEALEFYNRFGNLSEKSLTEQHRYDLAISITTRYPGSIQKLRGDLGLDNRQKAKGFWTEEKILDGFRQFYHQYGYLSFPFLREHGRNDLIGAVKKYPGQVTAIKEKLGISGASQELPISSDQANEQLQRLLDTGGAK